MRLPSSWGQANIHSSLLITLILLSFGTLVLSVSSPSFQEFKPLVLTLPAVWVISLTVRIAAQHVAIGSHSLELETVLGPTGNLSTHYEDLPPRVTLRYAVAGHLASLLLALLGAFVSAALIHTSDGNVRWSALWDVQGGWTNRALASQIMWINCIIGLLNLLPTVPFDCRALLYAGLSQRKHAEEPAVLARLATLDSHLAVLLFGSGTTLLFVNWATDAIYFGWYALFAAAVYLFLASRWESSRSRQLEEQYMPFVTLRRDPPHPQHAPHLAVSRRTDAAPPEAMTAGTTDSDVDEILRKIAREGTASLSIQEQETLLNASEKLKEQRKSSS